MCAMGAQWVTFRYTPSAITDSGSCRIENCAQSSLSQCHAVYTVYMLRCI